MEELREELLSTLARYQAARGHRLTVVFDGSRGVGQASEQRSGGRLRVVFSRQGQTADEAILRLLSGKGKEWVVVTSDRALGREAQASGAVVVSSEEFSSRLWEVLALTADEDEDEETLEPTLSTRKRGNPRRASRRERRRSLRLRKL